MLISAYRLPRQLHLPDGCRIVATRLMGAKSPVVRLQVRTYLDTYSWDILRELTITPEEIVPGQWLLIALHGGFDPGEDLQLEERPLHSVWAGHTPSNPLPWSRWKDSGWPGSYMWTAAAAAAYRETEEWQRAFRKSKAATRLVHA
jgi:hypothetical protein